jgi:hypothetical protein
MHVSRRIQARSDHLSVKFSDPSVARNLLSVPVTSRSLQGRCRLPTLGASEWRRPTTPDAHPIIKIRDGNGITAVRQGNKHVISNSHSVQRA